MKTGRIKLFGTHFWILSVFILLFVGTVVCVKASNFVTPEADVVYTEDWEGTLVLNSDQTVKISGITHDNNGTSYGSAIKICGNSTVNLVFEGTNVLSGNSSVTSAGIEVEEGSTVNIYGVDGSSLTVTGGNNSAGIGGIGYGSVSATNPKAGNVNIYSGNITAIGGNKGAGIGSGYHSSASDINIKGGNITALGTGSGAGIGSGYGTSGGAATAAGVGFYNGGNITISGGTVKAASYHINFDNFDPYNTETLYGEGYANTHAAGIGGGYGASSGNIVIEGDANVTAIGASGGAGIGSGRGTRNIDNYDAENFNVNIIIRGNSQVTAMATNDTRSTQTPEGGAAIGLGRGCTIDGDPKGSVKIEGNASVFAVAPYYAQAIGGSRAVGTAVIDAHLASIDLEKTTLIMAVGDGQREAIDNVDESELADFLILNFSDEYFQSHSDFFTEDKFPLKIEAIDAYDENSRTLLSIPSPSKHSFMVRVSGANRYSFAISDYQGEHGETIFISNSLEKNSAHFFSDPSVLKQYDAAGLTARMDRDEIINSDYGELKLKIRSSEGIFEYGSTFFCNAVEDPAIINELNSKLDKKYADKLKSILYFDIGVKDKNGENYIEPISEKVKIYIEVPAGWNRDKLLALFIKSEGDENFKDTQKLEVIDGVTYLTFETDHFGSYALFESIVEKKEENEHNKSGPEEENSSEINDEDTDFLKTGDKVFIICTVLVLTIFASLVLVIFLFKGQGKRFKK